MAANQLVRLCAVTICAQTVLKAASAFAAWQRVIVAIWALNPPALSSRVVR